MFHDFKFNAISFYENIIRIVLVYSHVTKSSSAAYGQSNDAANAQRRKMIATQAERLHLSLSSAALRLAHSGIKPGGSILKLRRSS
jgi:hypothetical protein